MFGSNLAGRHGKGAALTARQLYGAVYGQGEGLLGRSYALPTKSASLHTLPLDHIRRHAELFVAFAHARHDLAFYLTRVGCGLAGYRDAQVAPLFADAPGNVLRPPEWGRHLERDRS
ncbi:hypothetical protein [Hyphomicrobium sp. NDB2Meth4]|uniref:A1S_2505 family phage non-structural protein n=1 Tax=Hyphomicrobium sp. NDB2Meth4 TaxID=1892846 RepID=UPI001FCD6D84|nr:hypothetical protein [Hyphomicrobium sp. NDB2Meth4]